ncbi:MAG: hypothetical protein D6689_00015 [Deltaproteobacteria bacterium]|nr:MAG: hypothetical protein D6689_00015 [Deltaproteobacteria bacterium]
MEHAEVSFDDKRAVVSVGPGGASTEAMIASLEAAGYGGSVVDGGAGAAAPPPPPGYSSAPFAERVRVRAVVDRAPLAPGEPFRVAAVIDVADGWHIYGNPVGPGVGKPTVVSLVDADGATGAAARYAPGAKVEQDFGDAGKTWVYESTGRVVHYVAGAVAADAAPGPRSWKLRVEAQVCDPGHCIPGSAVVDVPVDIAARGAAPGRARDADLFAGFEAARAAPAGQGAP